MARRSRTAWIPLALVAALIGIALLLFGRPPQEPVSPTTVTPTATLSLLPVPPVTGASESDGAHPVSREPDASAPGADNLCGLHPQDQQRLPGETLGQHLVRATAPVLDRWKRALHDSASPHLQAMASAVDSLSPGDDVSAGGPEHPSPDFLDQAARSSDPVVYALGLWACDPYGFRAREARCRGLSIQHWAEIDPDSAIPWLWRVQEAQSLGDTSASEEAMRRASTAPNLSNPLLAVAQEAYALLPADAGPLDRIVAQEELMDFVPASGIGMLFTQCNEAQLANPNKRTLCEALATHLAPAAKGIESAYGAPEFYRRLSWPTDFITTLEQSARPWNVALGIDAHAADNPIDPYSCDWSLPRVTAIDQLFARH